jgi:hypothetical protein
MTSAQLALDGSVGESSSTALVSVWNKQRREIEELDMDAMLIELAK